MVTNPSLRWGGRLVWSGKQDDWSRFRESVFERRKDGRFSCLYSLALQVS